MYKIKIWRLIWDVPSKGCCLDAKVVELASKPGCDFSFAHFEAEEENLPCLFRGLRAVTVAVSGVVYQKRAPVCFLLVPGP